MSFAIPPRRRAGRFTAVAVGAALALTPTIASATPSGTSTAPSVAPLAAPIADFSENAALATHWLAESNLDSLSLDAALAFAGAGYGEAVKDEVLEWAKNERDLNDANAGKLAQVLGIYGEGENLANYYGEDDLEQQLRDAVDGQAADDNKKASIYELPFLMFGLQYTDDGVPEKAVEALKSLQCTTESDDNYGSFSWSKCGEYDMDGTSWAVQAFIGAGESPEDQHVKDAVNFLANHQNDEHGGFENDVSKNIVANTNTSGLAVQAMRAAGKDSQANKGAQFIADLQAGWSPKGDVPAGLIAYDRDGYDAFENGETSGNEAMATMQAMLAFGDQSFADLNLRGSMSELPDALIYSDGYETTDNDDALLATHWLENEIEKHDGLLPNYGDPDWGITLDSLLSLAAASTGADAAETVLDRFADEGDEYIGYGTPQVAKAAYTLLVYGEDPRTFFDDNLLTELRDAHNSDGSFGSEANATSQSFALLSLARTKQGSPESGAEWLADQQCTEQGAANYGAYGVPYGENTVCDVADADTTGLVIQALGAAGVDENEDAIANGLNWLVESQNTAGAIETWGDTSANSTAWAGQALAAFGQEDGADAARSFLNSQVIKPGDVEESAVLKQSDAGLIPSTTADRTAVEENGTEDVLDAARFATAQAPIGMVGKGLAELSATDSQASSPAPTFGDDASGGSNSDKPGAGDGSTTTAPTAPEDEGMTGEDGEPATPVKASPRYTG